jgi:hypothetical protein
VAMAHLDIDAASITVVLSELEKVETLHGDVTVPRSAVVGARVVPVAVAEVHGLRAPGTGLPGVVVAGTFRGKDKRMFAVCHGRGPGLVIELIDAAYDEIVLTLDDPEQAAVQLG